MLLLGLVLLAVSTAGCTRDRHVGDIPVELTGAMEDYIDAADDLATALEKITDADSVEAALDEIADAVSGLAIARAILTGATVRRQVRLELRYEGRLKEARGRVIRQVVRLMSKKPTALALRKALARVPTLIRSSVAADGS